MAYHTTVPGVDRGTHAFVERGYDDVTSEARQELFDFVISPWDDDADRYIDTEQYPRNGFGDWENGRVMDPRFLANYEARFCRPGEPDSVGCRL